MKRYADRETFYADLFTRMKGEVGLRQHSIDEYHIHVLETYRQAAAFAVMILNIAEVKDEKTREIVAQTLKECEDVLADESVYVLDDTDVPEFSKQLKAAVNKADDAIAHAANLCNNLIPCLPVSDKIIAIGLRARNVCDRASRRIRFS